MTKDELLARLKGFEWNDVEFKLAQRGVPDDSYETVSSFANTSGGWLVFGIRQQAGGFSIEGVVEVDKVQNDFLSTIRSRQKLNREISVAESAIEHEGANVLAFYVPELPRGAKPAYLKGDIRQSFIRRGGGDERCTQAEIERMLRDASSTRFDGEVLDLDPTRCFDEPSIRWYRTVFNRAKPGTNETVDDLTFLHNWGFVVEQKGNLAPTRSAVLLFGADAYLRQVLPRMVVDFQLYNGNASDYTPEIRWADRLQAEENLVKTWQAVSSFFFKHAERPFSVDAVTLRRADDPPGYVSFREAAINLLIHQDFGDHTRVPVIRFFRDQSEFFNPGDAFATREQLIDPGDKEVRNPTVVSAFRRIGLSDQGGTGVGAIYAGSRKLGYMPPVIDNNKADKTFRLRLPKDRLLSEEQVLVQASLGVTLSDHEAAVFAFLTRKGTLDIADIKGLTGLNGPGAVALAHRLTAQVLIEPVQKEGHTFAVAQHLRGRLQPVVGTEEAARRSVDGRLTVQVTEQVAGDHVQNAPPLVQLTPVQWLIVNHADTPRKLQELMEVAGYKQRPFFKASHLQPLLAAGVLRMTVPDRPRSSNQQYVLTDAGIKLKDLHSRREQEDLKRKS